MTAQKLKLVWENLTLEEAQELADCLCSTFSVTAKCWCRDVRCFLFRSCRPI